jgi:hypothetical protein
MLHDGGKIDVGEIAIVFFVGCLMPCLHSTMLRHASYQLLFGKRNNEFGLCIQSHTSTQRDESNQQCTRNNKYTAINQCCQCRLGQALALPHEHDAPEVHSFDIVCPEKGSYGFV